VTNRKPAIVFGEVSAGWVPVTVQHEYQAYFSDVSDLSDGLGELIRAVQQVVTLRLSDAECRWEREPGYDVVSLRARNEYPYIDVAIGYDPYEDPGPAMLRATEFTFKATFDFHDLVIDVIAAYRGLLDAYGADDYLKRWGYPFPLAEVESLEVWLKVDAERFG
jgi:hypothetical protein